MWRSALVLVPAGLIEAEVDARAILQARFEVLGDLSGRSLHEGVTRKIESFVVCLCLGLLLGRHFHACSAVGQRRRRAVMTLLQPKN